MIKLFSSLSAIILVYSFCSFQASADNGGFQYKSASESSFSNTLPVKSSTDKPVSNDPTMRTGTLNSESPQGSFFVVPAIMIGLFALILFFKEK